MVGTFLTNMQISKFWKSTILNISERVGVNKLKVFLDGSKASGFNDRCESTENYMGGSQQHL